MQKFTLKVEEYVNLKQNKPIYVVRELCYHKQICFISLMPVWLAERLAKDRDRTLHSQYPTEFVILLAQEDPAFLVEYGLSICMQLSNFSHLIGFAHGIDIYPSHSFKEVLLSIISSSQ